MTSKKVEVKKIKKKPKGDIYKLQKFEYLLITLLFGVFIFIALVFIINKNDSDEIKEFSKIRVDSASSEISGLLADQIIYDTGTASQLQQSKTFYSALFDFALNYTPENIRVTEQQDYVLFDFYNNNRSVGVRGQLKVIPESEIEGDVIVYLRSKDSNLDDVTFNEGEESNVKYLQVKYTSDSLLDSSSKIDNRKIYLIKEFDNKIAIIYLSTQFKFDLEQFASQLIPVINSIKFSPEEIQEAVKINLKNILSFEFDRKTFSISAQEDDTIILLARTVEPDTKKPDFVDTLSVFLSDNKKTVDDYSEFLKDEAQTAMDNYRDNFADRDFEPELYEDKALKAIQVGGVDFMVFTFTYTGSEDEKRIQTHYIGFVGNNFEYKIEFVINYSDNESEGYKSIVDLLEEIKLGSNINSSMISSYFSKASGEIGEVLGAASSEIDKAAILAQPGYLESLIAPV